MSDEKVFNRYYYLGNREIINHYKVGFLCSRKVPAEKILKIYDWAIEQREKGVCVVSGFHSKIEKDVFHYLSKGKQPIVLALARGLFMRCPKQISELLKSNRLLVISSFDKFVKRVTEKTSTKRNIDIYDICDEMVIGYQATNGKIEKLMAEMTSDQNVIFL